MDIHMYHFFINLLNLNEYLLLYLRICTQTYQQIVQIQLHDPWADSVNWKGDIMTENIWLYNDRLIQPQCMTGRVRVTAVWICSYGSHLNTERIQLKDPSMYLLRIEVGLDNCYQTLYQDNLQCGSILGAD